MEKLTAAEQKALEWINKHVKFVSKVHAAMYDNLGQAKPPLIEFARKMARHRPETRTGPKHYPRHKLACEKVKVKYELL